jgi:hypothetical protein
MAGRDDGEDAIVAALEKAGFVLLYTPERGYYVRPRNGTAEDLLAANGTLVFNEVREQQRFEIWGSRRYPGVWRSNEAFSTAADMMMAGWIGHAVEIATSTEASTETPEGGPPT